MFICRNFKFQAMNTFSDVFITNICNFLERFPEYNPVMWPRAHRVLRKMLEKVNDARSINPTPLL
jgi:hypothetical protein